MDSLVRVEPIRETFISVIRWLTEPGSSLTGPMRRQAHLLAWILLFLVILSLSTLLLVLIDNPAGNTRRSAYTWLIFTLTSLTTIAYGLNRAGHYYKAASLTVASAILGPWGSMMLDPSVLLGDFVPLTYVALTILLSSMLLPVIVTSTLAALQIMALAIVPFFVPIASSINWPSLVTMVFFTSVLSIAVNIINQRAIKQIENQTHQLTHSNNLIHALAHITTQVEKALSAKEIIQVVGEELNKMDLSCIIVIFDSCHRVFSVNYTFLKEAALEHGRDETDFSLMNSTRCSQKLNDLLNLQLRQEVITQPGDEIQAWLNHLSLEKKLEVLREIGVEPDTEPLHFLLKFEENLSGILCIWGKGISKEDLPVMSTFAKQIATAMERARLFQEVQALSLTDPLTGLQNRRSLFELGRIEFARSYRTNRPFCCMLLDVDHFKRINDNYGHQIGDQVLSKFAERCKSSVRQTDLIGRYGGEELLIFLPETDFDTAMIVAERLRSAVEGTPVRASDRDLQVTVSLGVSGKDENTPDLETLIARADQALYIAKHRGRNQVAISK